MQCAITQGFSGNATSTYVAGGLKGHTGVDSSCGFGSPIYSLWDKEYVYKVLTKENPANDGSGFTGVFTLVEKDGKVFEFLYGHCNPSPALLGATITKGTLIGTEANNGEVYANGIRITLEMQRGGDKRGTHRHDQARTLRKDREIQPNTRYLSSLGGGYFYHEGYFYAIPDYNNGFNGCFDFTPLLGIQPVIQQAPKLPKHIQDFKNSCEACGGLENVKKAVSSLEKLQLAEKITPYPNIGAKTSAVLKKNGIL